MSKTVWKIAGLIYSHSTPFYNSTTTWYFYTCLVTQIYLSPNKTDFTSGISKILLAKGEALASFSLRNSYINKTTIQYTIVWPYSGGRISIAGVGTNFWTSGFGVSLTYTNNERLSTAFGTSRAWFANRLSSIELVNSIRDLLEYLTCRR